MFRFQYTIFILAAVFAKSVAFTLPPSASGSRSTTHLNFFGGALKKAFESDDKLGKQQNAGLTNGPNENDNVTLNGKKIKAVVGQKVSVVAAQNRVKITYSCKKGDCGTCEIMMNGRMTKACQASIPQGKCDMRTL